MAKICNYKVGLDKLVHLLTEFIIAAFIGVILSLTLIPSSWYAFGIAFIIAFAIGVFKESINVHKTGHHFHLLDLFLDLLGCLLGASVVFLSDLFTWFFNCQILL